MKKVLVLLLCLAAFAVQTQAAVRQKSPEDMARIRQALNMKIFHDKVFVKSMFQSLREQEESGISSDPQKLPEIGHEGIFSSKDSDIIRKESANKVVRTKLIQKSWDEQSEAIDADPFDAFIGLIENQEVPDLKKDELDNINSVDKRVIPETIKMLTESGPDVGASAVSISYDSSNMLQ